MIVNVLKGNPSQGSPQYEINHWAIQPPQPAARPGAGNESGPAVAGTPSLSVELFRY